MSLQDRQQPDINSFNIKDWNIDSMQSKRLSRLIVKLTLKPPSSELNQKNVLLFPESFSQCLMGSCWKREQENENRLRRRITIVQCTAGHYICISGMKAGLCSCLGEVTVHQKSIYSTALVRVNVVETCNSINIIWFKAIYSIFYRNCITTQLYKNAIGLLKKTV